MINIQYTQKDTNIAKGIALFLLLVHHLFYSYNPSLYSDIYIFSYKDIVFGLFNIFACIFKIF